MKGTDYDRMFAGRIIPVNTNMEKQLDALIGESYDRIKGSKYGFRDYFYSAPSPTLENMLKVENYNKFLKRKYYETVIWDTIKTSFKGKVQQAGELITIGNIKPLLQEFLIHFIYTVIKHENGVHFFEVLEDRFNSKITIFLTGIIDYPTLIGNLKALKRNAGEQELKDNIKNNIDLYCANIRTSLTLIDFFVKTFEKLQIGGVDSNGKIAMEYYVGLFDNCIRHRDTIPKMIKKDGVNVPNEVNIKDFLAAEQELRNYFKKQACEKSGVCNPNSGPELNERTHLYINDVFEKNKFCIKDYSLFCKGRNEDCNKKHECANVDNTHTDGKDDMIEPYSIKEKAFIDDLYHRGGKVPQFESGINSFYLNSRPLDTIDIFAAGISGHTAEIGLMFNLFTNFKSQNEAVTQKFIAISALIWMIDYLHHSLREILLASLIHFKDNSKNSTIISDIEYLYSSAESGDKSIEFIVAKIDKIITNLFESSKGGAISLRRNLKFNTPENLQSMKSMINFFLSTEGKNGGDDVKEKLNNAEASINEFRSFLAGTNKILYDSIKWPEKDGKCKNYDESSRIYLEYSNLF